MNNFYFTFGCGQKHENHYVKIEAVSMWAARAMMMRHYGMKWSSAYKEEFWNSEDHNCRNYLLLEELIQDF